MDKNSLWSDLEAGPSNVSDSVMGPDYSYAENIQGPSSMGVGSDGTFSQVGRNTGAVINYVKYMVSGPALGNQYFVNTGGVCIAPDKSTQPRYNYINNLSSGTATVPLSMRQDLSSISSDFNGLLPGMLEDIEGLNPVSLFSALAASSTPTCECYTCPTSGGNKSYFLNTTLSPDYDPAVCTKTDVSACTKSTEGFTESGSALVPIVAAGLLALLNLF